MTGTIVQVPAERATPSSRGALVLVVEAMKMEHRVVAPAAARIAAPPTPGDRVDVGARLVSLLPDGAP